MKKKRHALSEISTGVTKHSKNSSEFKAGSKAADLRNPMAMYNRKAPKLFGRLDQDAEVSTSLTQLSAANESIYVQAEFLLEMLAKRNLSISLLTPEQKIILFLYLFKYNSKMGRIIDLFVSIPLSGLELKYPDNIENPILLDFIKDFFDSMWERSNLVKELFKMYRDYRLIGFSSMIVSDDYTVAMTVANENGDVRKEEVLDFNHLDRSMKMLAKSKITSLSEEEQEKIAQLTRRYEKDKDSLTTEELREVIYAYIPNLQGSDLVGLKDDEYWVDTYSGVSFVRTMDVFEALQRVGNPDISFYSYTLQPDPKFSFLKEESPESKSNSLDMLANLGYTKSYVSLFSDDKEFQLNSYPYTDTNTWVVHLENIMAYSSHDKSIINRVLDHAVDIEVVKKSNRIKALRAYKNIYLFSSEVSGDNFDTVDSLLRQAVDSEESTYLFTNKPINVDNIAFDSRQLVDLDSMAQKAEDELINGLGMVDTLTGSADSYANSYLKLEMLGNQFTQERIELARMVEEMIFKPVAIKKGLFIKDKWGHVKPIYPKISFDRINFARSTEDFQMLLSLAQSGKIPYSYILKALNFNPQDIQRELVSEQSTAYNDKVLGFVTDKLLENEEFSKFVMRDKGHIKSLLRALNIEADDVKVNSLVTSIKDSGAGVDSEDQLEELADKLYERWKEEHPEDEESDDEPGETEFKEEEGVPSDNHEIVETVPEPENAISSRRDKILSKLSELKLRKKV